MCATAASASAAGSAFGASTACAAFGACAASQTSLGKFFAEPNGSGFSVEDEERTQADVEDFLVIESDFVTRVQRRQIR
jgi:hypothetical protein